jgi:ClpP class serine protease
VKKNLKVYTFAKDLAASGGYFVLCTGNEVYADKTSIVGSIGVVFSKMQLQGLLDLTSTEMKNISSNKYRLLRCRESLRDIMSPFHHLTRENREQVLSICHSTHTNFINHVKKYRSNKLHIDDDIFSG